MKFSSVLATVFFAGTVHAADGMIAIKSAHSVKDTITKFETVAKERGLHIFARIDHVQARKKSARPCAPLNC